MYIDQKEQNKLANCIKGRTKDNQYILYLVCEKKMIGVDAIDYGSRLIGRKKYILG